MKTFAVLGGYGEMGRIASKDLAETSKGRVIVAGRDEKKAREYATKLGRNALGVGVDVTNRDKLVALLKDSDVAVNCTQYYYNLDVMKACLEAGCHYLDLGGLFHMTKKQLKLHDKFKKKKLTAVLGCGSTPGITNVLAGYGAKKMDKIDAIRVRFAGYSFTKQTKHFVVPYSMYTLFDEFTAKPAVFKNGRMIFVKPISGKAEEYFPSPINRVTTFYTLHSEVATFPASFKNKGIKNCDFKVAFDEDFVHDVELFVETGLASKKPIEIGGVKVKEIDVTVKELNRLIPSGTKVKDVEYVRVVLIGEQAGKGTELTVDCVAHSNEKWSASAGDVDTGVPPSVIAQMIAKNQIKQRGVLAPELCVPAELFFKELTKRNMQVITTAKRIEFG